MHQYREFPTWGAYYSWRDAQVGWQHVSPCVRHATKTKDCRCLSALIVIGAFKGGTTGVRYKLLASEQFYGPMKEYHFWAENEPSVDTPREMVAAKYAISLPCSLMLRREFVVFEDNPRYVDELNTNVLRRIRKVNPDALMLLLARPGADIHFSALEMSADDVKDCAPFRPFGHNCGSATKYAAANAHAIFNEGILRAVAMERDWGDRDVISLHHRAGQYVAKGGYYYVLRHIWHTWPREQTLVLESTALWMNEREGYNTLADALRLNFTIRLVPNTRTRPPRQDHPQCPPEQVETMKLLISECDLKMPYRCAWHSANMRLAELLHRSWPLSWNDGVNMSTCAPHNFTTADLNAGVRVIWARD